MLVNGMGDITITNDGATIMREMEINQPAARMLVETAKKQEEIVGDGTTSVVVIAGELLAKAEELLDEGIAVKIVEKDLAICKKLAETFPDAVVIHGDATNQRLLLEEGLETTDSIVTLTGMDETNIIVSSFAKNKNVNKSVFCYII